MKKIIALALVLVLALGLMACGAKEAPAEENPAVDTTAPVEDATTEGDAVVETNGTLTMATNAQFPPYEYYEGDQVVGIDAEIAAAIAAKLGMELVIEDMEFDSIIEAVKSGKADIGMAGMTVTPEREEVVNFTVSYATGRQVVIVTEDSAIASVDDLFVEGNNYIIGVQRNTTGDLYTTWDLEDMGLATIDRYSKGADAVQALLTGKVDCVVIDNEPANAFVAETEGLKILDTEYVEELYAGAMSKDNTELYDAVNAALEELIADGTVQAIIDKYISAE